MAFHVFLLLSLLMLSLARLCHLYLLHHGLLHSRAVQRFTVVDKSDISPPPLTVHSDPPYSKEALPSSHFK